MAWGRTGKSLITLASASLMGGLCAPDPGPSRCSLDPTACGPAVSWSVMRCEGVDPAEPLAVTVGGGDERFEPYAATAPPEVHFGLQGGQHSFVAFRVANARLDLYERLRITLWMAQGDRCVVPDEPLGDAPASCPIALGRRQIVLGTTRFPLEIGPTGEVERAGLVLFLNEPPMLDTPAVIVAEVEDPCGRKGLDGFAWTPR